MGPYFLKVGVPDPFGSVVGMADVISFLWPFATNLADSRHLSYLMTLMSSLCWPTITQKKRISQEVYNIKY
jgi:hypothetical protein